MENSQLNNFGKLFIIIISLQIASFGYSIMLGGHPASSEWDNSWKA